MQEATPGAPAQPVPPQPPAQADSRLRGVLQLGVVGTVASLLAAGGGILIDQFSTVPCALSPGGCEAIPLYMKGLRLSGRLPSCLFPGRPNLPPPPGTATQCPLSPPTSFPSCSSPPRCTCFTRGPQRSRRRARRWGDCCRQHGASLSQPSGSTYLPACHPTYHPPGCNHPSLPQDPFAAMLGLAFVMVAIAGEIGWHVTQVFGGPAAPGPPVALPRRSLALPNPHPAALSLLLLKDWFYVEDYSILNFVFYFFLMLGTSLWALGIKVR